MSINEVKKEINRLAVKLASDYDVKEMLIDAKELVSWIEVLERKSKKPSIGGL